MGLDQYLRARTNTIEQKSSRGACGGLFPIAPADKGTTEIGYWRKAYAVSDYLRQVLEIYDDFNLEDKEVPYNKVLEIIDYANEQIDRKAFEDEYELSDWQDTVEAFTKAKQILENDPDAEIYYLEWYDFLCDKYCLKMLLQNREFLCPYHTSIMPITVAEKTCKAYRSTCEHSPANSLAQQTKFLVCCCAHIDLRKCRKASAAQNILPYDIC